MNEKNDRDQMHIRKLDEDDLEQYNDLLRYAFQVTEKMLQDIGWENEDIRQSKFPVLARAQVLGYFDGSRLASQFAVYPLRMNVHGTPLNIGFVTSVSTYPEYAGMGLMSELMLQSLTEMRDAGQSLSLLYPYSIPLYRHKGWEIISDKMAFRVKDHQLPRHIEVPGFIRRVADDSSDLMTLHMRFAGQTHGCIYRNDLAWEEYWRWDVDDTEIAIYYSEDGEPMGYMVYLLRDDEMHIKEMVYLNNEAWKGLWRYIAAHESMVGLVSGSNYANEPIAFWLEDSDIKETIRPYIMGRIVDCEHFLSHFPFQSPEVPDAITLDVQDGLLDWNNRTFTLRFDGQGGVMLCDEPTEKRIQLSIGTLTTMLLGYKRPSYLLEMERMRGSIEAAALLDAVIPDLKPQIADYI